VRLKGIFAMLDTNLDHGDLVYNVHMYEIKRMEGLNGHIIMLTLT